MKDESEMPKIPDAYRVFVLISITNLLVSLDHGIIPAGNFILQLLASIQVQNALFLTNEELGILGSLVYAGTVVLGFLASFLFLKYNPLRVIEISMITMILSLFVFTLQFDAAWPYYVSRFITGAAQAPLIVYFPVWVDTFGLENKTVWLTILQGGVPFGVFVGYVLASVIAAQWNWRWAFYLQIMVLIPSIILLSRQPLKNIDVRPYVKDKNTEYEKMSYVQLMKITLNSVPYVTMTIVLGLLYFSVTGIQFWISNYLVSVLKFNQALVNTLFSLDSISGPTLGCVLGGVITQYYGGYDSKNAYYIACIAAFLGSLSSALVTVTQNLWAITAFIWLLLFFGGALVPILTGIVLSSVNQGMRSFANSNTTTYVNLFGYLPAPIVYGYLTSISQNLGYYVLMYCPSVGCLLIIWTTYRERHRDCYVEENDSLEMHPPSVRSGSVMQLFQNFHNQSDDFVKEMLEFHATPINHITTTLYYQK